MAPFLTATDIVRPFSSLVTAEAKSQRRSAKNSKGFLRVGSLINLVQAKARHSLREQDAP